MTINLKDIKKQAGIEDVVFVKPEQLLKDETTFCIHGVKSVDSQFSDKGQWRFAIWIFDTNLVRHTFYLSLAHDDRRDAWIPGLQEATDNGEVAHSYKLTVRQFKKGSRKYYDFEPVSNDATCACGDVNATVSDDTHTHDAASSQIETLLSEDVTV